MSFPKYLEYKDSEVGWLGEVPEHWHVTALKRGYEVVLGKMLQPEQRNSADQLLPYLRAANIQPEGVDLSDVRQMWFSKTEINHLSLRAGDLLVSEGGDVGRPAIWNSAGEYYFQNSINRIRSTGQNLTRFLYYWIMVLRAKGYIEVLCNKSTIAHFTAEKVAAVPVPFPPSSEQLTIARFLDHETAKIDALIQEQQRLIELLKEKRQAVISHAVTKGLDPSVPMKDSGVEWLGEVPKHWNISKLKQAIVFQRGHDLPSDLREPGTVPVVSSGGISGAHNVAKASAPGIVTGRYGSIGEFHLIEVDYWPLNTALYSIDLRQNDHKYLWFLLQSVSEHFTMNSMKSAVPGIDRNDIHEIAIVVAPRGEQQVIVDFLETELEKLQRLSDQITEGLHVMAERRSALVSAAVTGKIDVRNWKPPADEHAFDEEVRQAGLEAVS